MRKALALSLLAVLLGGCASDPADRDISGTWINQAAIDAEVRAAYEDYNLAIGGLQAALATDDAAVDKAIDDALKSEPPKTP